MSFDIHYLGFARISVSKFTVALSWKSTGMSQSQLRALNLS